jgi:hypothetical protein
MPEGAKISIAYGRIYSVSQANVTAMRKIYLDPCGKVGEYHIELPKKHHDKEKESFGIFYRLVIKKIDGKYLLHHVTTCN